MKISLKHKTIQIVLGITILSPFSAEIFLPSIPKIAENFGVHIHVVQWVITLYIIGLTISSLVCGALSDAFGRRIVILSCLGFGLIGSTICCLAPSINALYIGRFIQGVGFGGSVVSCRAICKDISNDVIGFSKLISLLVFTTLLGTICSPIIGGYIEYYLFWRISFLLILALNFIVFIISCYKLEETLQNFKKFAIKELVKDYLEILSNKTFLCFNFLSCAIFGGLTAYQTVSANLLEIKVGLSANKFGYTSAYVIISLMLGSIINRFVIGKIGLYWVMKIGGWLFLIAGILYFIFGLLGFINLFAVILPIMLYGLSLTMISPNLAGSAIGLYSDKSGTAASIFMCIRILGGVLGSAIVSIKPDCGLLMLGSLFIIVSILCMLIDAR